MGPQACNRLAPTENILVITMTNKSRTLSETAYGTLPKGSPNKNGCSAWQRADCLSIRIDNEPETLLVSDRPDILQCPVCAHIIQLEVKQ